MSASNNDECHLIQNQQLLLNQIPKELKRLPYGIYPQNAQYNNLRFVYNKLLNYFPHAIFYPRNTTQVSYLIRQFVKYNQEFAIRCGGHAYEPASLSSGYILDVKFLPRYVIINKNKNTVKVSAGLRFGDIIKVLSAYSLIIPSGTSPCVGVSGLSLQGGKGPLTRLYGLLCDNIVSLKMVNYKGKVFTISATQHADLFWAMKGAGSGNFGVVTEIEFKVYKDRYCQYQQLAWEWNSANVVEIYTLYQQWILTIPDTILADFNMSYNNKKASFSITFIKYDKQPFTEIDVFKNLHNPKVTIHNGPYSKVISFFIKPDMGKDPPFSKIKSSMIFGPIVETCINILVNSINTYLRYGFNLNYQLNFSQLGGAVQNNNSCYYPKNAIMVLSYFMQWTLPELTDNSILFLNNLYLELEPYTSPYCFTNLIDYDIVDYMDKYYGANKDELVQIKNKYDPDNIFKSRQSIRDTNLFP